MAAGGTGGLADVGVGSQISWGIQENVREAVKSVDSFTNGVITQWDCNTDYAAQPLRNEVNSTIGKRVYDYLHTANCTVQVPANAKKPKVKTRIEIDGGVVMNVKSARVAETNQNYRLISMVLEGFGYDITEGISEADNSFDNKGDVAE